MASVSGVGNNRGINTNVATSSNAVSGAAATGASRTSRAQADAVSAPIASGASAVTPPRVKINGIADAVAQKIRMPWHRPAAGQLPGAQTWGQASGWGGYARGYIEAAVTPAQGGWNFKVQVHHNSPHDKVNLFLSARVVDAPKEHWLILGVPFAGPLKATAKDAEGMHLSTLEFFVSIDDINKFLLKKAGTKADGKTPKLEFKPGDPLSVDAVWQDIGHESGGRRDQTKGYVVTPPPLGRNSVVDVRAGTAPVGQVKAVTGSAADKPVDLTLKVPDEIITKYPKVFAPGAKLVSRREAELKLEPKTFDELKQLTVELIRLARLPAKQQEAELKKIFGEDGWSIALTDRYYQKDANGNYVLYKPGELVWQVKDDAGERAFDFAGLPKVAGMYDKYQDFVRDGRTSWEPENFQVARLNGAVRFRDGEIKAGENKPTIGKFNLKPGGGVLDPLSLIATRVEYSLDTLPGIATDSAAMAQMRDFLDNGPAPYNPMAEFKKKAYNLSGRAVETNVLDNNAHRYKFTLKHTSGLELEISNDFITLTSQHSAIEPPSTQGKKVADKYAHWEKQFAAAGLSFSTKPGVVNKGTFVEYANGGKHRIEVEVEASVDAKGSKSVKETLLVRGRQVEIEMDHVQVFTSGPVQGPYNPATQQGSNATTPQEENKVFKSLSDNATLSGPPTVHNLADLSDPSLYSDSSYLQMREAAVRLREWAFPKGVNASRQKAAYGLEMMGQIPADRLPALSGTLKADKAEKVSFNAVGQELWVQGDLKSGKPATVELKVGDFPLAVQLRGNESSKQIAEAIAKEINKSPIYSAKVSQANYISRHAVSIAAR